MNSLFNLLCFLFLVTLVNGQNDCDPVGGSIVVHSTWAASLICPSVTSLSGQLSLTLCDHMTEITLTSLTTISARLYVGSNEKLTKILLANLVTIGGSLSIITNDDLEEIDFSSLETVSGDLNIGSNWNLEEFKMAELYSIDGTLTLQNNEHLEKADFPGLNTISEDVVLINNNDLTRLMLCELEHVEGDVTTNGNDNLNSVINCNTDRESSFSGLGSHGFGCDSSQASLCAAAIATAKRRPLAERRRSGNEFHQLMLRKKSSKAESASVNGGAPIYVAVVVLSVILFLGCFGFVAYKWRRQVKNKVSIEVESGSC